MPQEELLTGKVTRHEKIGERLRKLKVEAPKIEFAAGQFTKVGLQVGDDKPLMRAYSFVNPPAAAEYEFFYDVLHSGGNLTPLLDKLEEGDELLLSARPNGLLVLRELPPAKNLFLIATGTGIGPFLSMLQTDEPWEKFERVVLTHGVRHGADLLYQELIDIFKERHSDSFCYLPLVSREDWPAAQPGRITTLLQDGRLESLSGVTLANDCQFMMCGNPAMIKDMSELLKERGFERNRRARPGNVTIEKYW